MALARNVFRMLMGIIRGGRSGQPISLLDNSPLAEYLANSIDFEHIQEAIEQGNLHALSITAAGYGSGISHTFFQGAEGLDEWRRAKRVGVRAKIKLKHLMGSSAIPMVFPAVRIGDEYFGDGAVRQQAPISPAVHLGAHRAFVIGVSEERPWVPPVNEHSYPSIARVTGHVFNSAFLDSMGADIERLERINHIIRLVPNRVKSRDGMALHPIDFLVISPSESLDVIAARHVGELPRTIQWMLRRGGAVKPSTAPLVSYLLFESGFCRELIALGYRDGSAREQEILKFFGR
jgi:NTE family protein